MWNRIMSQMAAISFAPALGGIVVPHHMADKEYLAAVWRGVSAVTSPKLIVLFSPDHFVSEPGWITLPLNATFSTPYGSVLPAKDLVKKLGEDGSVRLSDGPFLIEHGIFAHTAFIARFFPGVPLLPIIIKQQTDRAALDKLVTALQGILPRETFFAASVDFSHYNPVRVSMFHDRSSSKAMLNMDLSELFDQEIDSPESLYVLASLMKSRGSSHVVQFLWTQLQSHFSYPISDNTSHLYFAFYPGQPVPVHAASFMIFPESSIAGNTGELAPDEVLESWRYSWLDPRRTLRLWPLLSRLAGQADRFLTGSDLYLFDLKPGLVVDKKASGLRVRIVSLPAGDREQRSPTRIAGLAGLCDLLVIVDYDISKDGRSQWREYARAGARIIVGRGGRSAVHWRVEDGTLFVDSLGLLHWGNIPALPSSVLGVYVDEQGCHVDEFPLELIGGIPAYRDIPKVSSYDRVGTTPMERE
jgi:AmmeMemoRadiSam system protein B